MANTPQLKSEMGIINSNQWQQEASRIEIRKEWAPYKED